MQELLHVLRAGPTPTQSSEVIALNADDEKLVTVVMDKISALGTELEATTTKLETAAAQAVREDFYGGSSVRLDTVVRDLSARVRLLQGQVEFYDHALIGLRHAVAVRAGQDRDAFKEYIAEAARAGRQ